MEGPSAFEKFFSDIGRVFSEYNDFLLTGLQNTLIISVGAAVLGLVLGVIVAIIKIAAVNNKKLRIPEIICNLYVGVIRGTPVALQLFIMAFVILAIRNFPIVITAILTFGINSGAYVAENLRAGIQSVDPGQTEAGRSLGLSGSTTMASVVLPQAVKNVIPAIGNELIALIKETSIVSMISIIDLTNAAKLIGGGNNMATYLVPMLVAALFYLAIVYILTFFLRLIEKKLRESEQHISDKKIAKVKAKTERKLARINSAYEKAVSKRKEAA